MTKRCAARRWNRCSVAAGSRLAAVARGSGVPQPGCGHTARWGAPAGGICMRAEHGRRQISGAALASAESHAGTPTDVSAATAPSSQAACRMPRQQSSQVTCPQGSRTPRDPAGRSSKQTLQVAAAAGAAGAAAATSPGGGLTTALLAAAGCAPAASSASARASTSACCSAHGRSGRGPARSARCGRCRALLLLAPLGAASSCSAAAEPRASQSLDSRRPAASATVAPLADRRMPSPPPAAAGLASAACDGLGCQRPRPR